MEEDFIECDTCRAKPGSPVLCRGCLSNRTLIDFLQSKIKRDESFLELLRDTLKLESTTRIRPL